MSNETLEKKDWSKAIISKIKENKKLIIATCMIILIIFILILFFEKRENEKNIQISKEFNKAKILIENKKKEESYDILENIINKKNKFYSPISLYLVIDFELEKDHEKVTKLFEKIISIKKIKSEDKNLIIIKKAIFMSNYYSENEMLKELNPIINSKSIWRKSALQILIDYFSIKGDQLKANQYKKILNGEVSQ